MKKISLLLILVLMSLACSLLYVYNKYSSQNQESKDSVVIQAMQRITTFKDKASGKKSTIQSKASSKYQTAQQKAQQAGITSQQEQNAKASLQQTKSQTNATPQQAFATVQQAKVLWQSN